MKNLAWGSTLVLIGCYIMSPLSDPDLWWHLSVGRWILSHGSLPITDHWNLFAAGKPWQAYSWSNELVYAAAYQFFNYQGLLLLKLVLALLLPFSLAYSASLISGSYVIGLLLAVAGTAGCYAHFDLRPQTVSWILFALLIYQVEQIRKNGRSFRSFISVLLLMTIWANTHLTTALGLLFAALWLIDFETKGLRWRLTALTVSSGFLGTLLTPYLGKEWLTLAGKAEHPFLHMYITEFQPLTLHHTPAVIILLLAATYFLIASDSRRFFGLHVSALILLVASFAIQKFLPFAAVFLPLAIARVWAESAGSESKFTEGIRRLETFLNNLPAIAYLSVCLVLLLVAWLKYQGIASSPVDKSLVAVDAVDFIRQRNLPPPYLNTFNDGGYLLHRFSNKSGESSILVPLDGRTNVNDTGVVKKFLAAFYGKPSWRELFGAVTPSTVLWPNASPLVTILLERSEWCHVFPLPEESLASDPWSVFLRRDELERMGLRSRNCP